MRRGVKIKTLPKLITCGANALYSDKFGECFNFHSSPHIQYRGVLSRNDLFGLLTTAHVWAYANHESSETFCVSVIEAMALGIPVVVYNKEPFVSVVPEAFFVNNEEEMADKIADILENGPNRVDYDMSRYSEKVVVPQILKEIEEML
jgi:glycosyltransferase involved in cell wall biosynthesis